MSSKLRVVLAGCGGITHCWLGSDAVKSGKVEIVGLVDLRRKSAQARAEQFNLDKAVVGTNLKDVLKATQPEAVFDCTVPEAHCEITTTALRHGCHVLGEKPMADSMSSARKMVAAAKKAGKIYAVTQTRRYIPETRAVERFIASRRYWEGHNSPEQLLHRRTLRGVPPEDAARTVAGHGNSLFRHHASVHHAAAKNGICH
jgi:predicted dehydrogenase